MVSLCKDQDAIALVKAAYTQGVRMFDTADMYGYGRNEQLIGAAACALMTSGVAER